MSKRNQGQATSEKKSGDNQIKLKIGPFEIEGSVRLTVLALICLIAGIALALFVVTAFQQPSFLIDPLISRAVAATIAAQASVTSASTTALIPPTATPVPLPDSSGGVFYFLEANGEVVMEAEHFTDKLSGSGDAFSHSWKETKDFSGYTGDSALQALPNLGTHTHLETYGPALLYVIKFQTAGDYYVYVRGFAPSGDDDDSVHVGLAGNAATTSDGDGLKPFNSGGFNWQNEHSGTDTVIDVPAPGIYTFYIWMREDGVVVDRIWLNTRKDAVSNGKTSPGPEESPRRPLGG